MTTTEADFLRNLIGRCTQASDECALPLVQRLLAFLDRDSGELRNGDLLPVGWQVVLFAPLAPQGQLGPDGTPDQTKFLPPVPGFPRRMMGGRKSRFLKPLPIGSQVHRTTEIVSAVIKTGKSGKFVIVKNLHRIFIQGDSAPSIEEEYDVVFREPAGGADGAAGVRDTTRREAAARKTFVPNEAMIFRYSAATFNAHRIHYDLPYARETEKYPKIVVNGGIAAIHLLEFAKTLIGDAIVSVETRLAGSAFCGEPIDLCWAGPSNPSSFWSESGDGRPNVEMTILTQANRT